MAEWLESYAKTLELNVWTSSTVLGAKQDTNNEWIVRVQRPDGSIRVFHVNHLGICFANNVVNNSKINNDALI
jgi:hypothetical protein